MAKKSIFARMFEAFARDAEPDEVLEAAQATKRAEEQQDEAPAPGPQQSEPTYDEGMEMVMDAIHELNEKIEAMQQSNAAHHAEEAQDEEPEEPNLDTSEVVSDLMVSTMDSELIMVDLLNRVAALEAEKGA